MGFDYLYKHEEKNCASGPLKVLLDGHPYGEIRKVEKGYQHFSEGYWYGGEIFGTVFEVQTSLRALVREDVTANGKLIEEIDKMKTDAKAVNEKLVWAKTLLAATSDLFESQKDSEDALNLLEESVAYDDVGHNGYSLYDDIQRLINALE